VLSGSAARLKVVNTATGHPFGTLIEGRNSKNPAINKVEERFAR
jgi:hypothetical protein